MCNSQQYSKTWFGSDPACYDWNHPSIHTCMLTQSFFCGNDTPNGRPLCKYGYDNGGCYASETLEDLCSRIAPPGDCALQSYSDTSASCTHHGSAAEKCGGNGHGDRVDDNDNGCSDEGCLGGEGECTCTKSCASLHCSPATPATCNPYNGNRELCTDFKDNNCNGLINEGCTPKLTCPAKAGQDPILLASQAAVSEPFTDFEVQFVSKLSITRTYNSNDASVATGQGAGIFGRGWRHDWESGLLCDASGVCTALRGLDPGMRFAPNGTALSLDGNESWAIYSPYSDDVTKADQHNVLVQRPGGQWRLYLSDGSVEIFEAVESACSGADAGIARLVQSVDAQGNSVFVSYDAVHGLLMGLSDDLGHSLELRGEGTCPSRATELRLDGAVVATYSYTGQDLASVTDGDGLTMRSYSYDLGGAGLLRGITNGAGEIVAEFSYDDFGRAIGLVDYASSVSVNYDAPGGIAVTEAFRGKDGDTTGTSLRTLNDDGRVVSTSDGCACGPANTQEWNDHLLTCSRDSLGHVTHNDRDALGRITRTVVFPGASCTVPATLPNGSTTEYRSYGLARNVADGVTLDLDTVLTVIRPSDAVAGGSAREIYDYDQAPDPTLDPLEYACTATPLAQGSVLCRQISHGYVFVDTGLALKQIRHATFFSYDARGRLVRTYGPINLDLPNASDIPPIEERTYWGDGESAARRGRLQEVRRYPRPDATPLLTSYDYDVFGVYQVIDERGVVTTTVKDGRGRPTYVIAVDGGVTETRYHEGRSPRLQLLPGGAVLRYGYDNLGRVASIEHLDGDPEALPGVTVVWSEHFTYDAAGNRVHEEQRDRDGTVTWQVDRGFDVQHRVVWQSNPEQPTVGRTWTYDAAGALSATLDETGRGTNFVPDTMGRVQKVERSGPPSNTLDVATYTYQGSTTGIAKVVGGNQPAYSYSTASYANDDFGRLYRLNSDSIIFGTQNFWYDARGNLVRKRNKWTNNDIINVTYTYDGLDRPTSITSGAITYRYTYDTPPYQGRLTSVQEPDRVITYQYDPAGRLMTESVQENGAPAPLVTAYTYDPSGRVQQVSYPSGLRVRYDPDPATGEIARVSNVDTGRRYADSVSHVPLGPVNGMAYGNGLRLDATFNRRHEPVSIADGPVVLQYGMNAAGDVEVLSDRSATLSGSQDVTRTYTYDFLDRVTGSPSWISYVYDGAGNRTSETADGVQSNYSFAIYSNQIRPDNPLHRKVGTAKKHSFVYDTHGNVSGLASWANPSNPLVDCLVHDSLGRLVSVGKGSGGIALNLDSNPLNCLSDNYITQFVARYKYDSSNRRVARQDAASGQWTYTTTDAGGHPLSELALVNGLWVRVRDYVWLDGKPLAQIEYPGPSSGEGYVYYLHTDHLGLPRGLTNAMGQLVWSAATKPYGELVESTATDPLSGRTVVTNLRLPGQYDERLLGSLGLQGPYYNWNRWYLPGVGRYLEPDPLALGGHFNTQYGVDWYGYGLGSPFRYTDPMGLCNVMCTKMMIAPPVWLCFRATDEQDMCPWYNPKKYLWQFDGQYTGELPGRLIDLYDCKTWDNDIRPRLKRGNFPVPYMPPFRHDPNYLPPYI
jgi:RHS repeat-associated protein